MPGVEHTGHSQAAVVGHSQAAVVGHSQATVVGHSTGTGVVGHVGHSVGPCVGHSGGSSVGHLSGSCVGQSCGSGSSRVIIVTYVLITSYASLHRRDTDIPCGIRTYTSIMMITLPFLFYKEKKDNCGNLGGPNWPIYIVACQAHPALVKRSGVRTVFISLLIS